MIKDTQVAETFSLMMRDSQALGQGFPDPQQSSGLSKGGHGPNQSLLGLCTTVNDSPGHSDSFSVL